MHCVCGSERSQRWISRQNVLVMRCTNCGTGYPVTRSINRWTEEQTDWVATFGGENIVSMDPLLQLAAERRTVDVLTAFHLADVPDVDAELKRAEAMLRRDGILLIEVPQRLNDELHRWYFSAWALQWLLEQTGFLVLSTEESVTHIRIVATPQAHVTDLRIIVPSGIGDIHWMVTKMEALKEREAPCKLTVVVQAQGEPEHVRRTEEYLALVPFVDNVEYQDGPVPSDTGCLNILEPTYSWIANFHLEAGRRLEDWRPELTTNWHYMLAVPDSCRRTASMIRRMAGGRTVLLYLSSTTWNHVTTAMADWRPKDWAILAESIAKEFNCKPIIIGKDWDQGYASDFWRLVDPDHFIDLIDRTPFPLAAALLESADLVVGMGTGITMMGVHFGARTIMFWPEEGKSHGRLQFDARFQTNWVSPDMLGSGRYTPMSLGQFKVADVLAAVRKHMSSWCPSEELPTALESAFASGAKGTRTL